MEKPILFMIVGLPGSGKTTKAKEIEQKYSALRLTPDEWILHLYGSNLDRKHTDALRDPIEQLQWQVAKRVLSLGRNVVIDWGFWSASEREKYRHETEIIGAIAKIVFMDVPVDELWSRISGRPESQEGTLHFTRAELDEWASGFEPPAQE